MFDNMLVCLSSHRKHCLDGNTHAVPNTRTRSGMRSIQIYYVQEIKNHFWFVSTKHKENSREHIAKLNWAEPNQAGTSWMEPVLVSKQANKQFHPDCECHGFCVNVRFPWEIPLKNIYDGRASFLSQILNLLFYNERRLFCHCNYSISSW